MNVQSDINRIFQEFNTTQLQYFKNAVSLWKKYAIEVPSSSRSTMHAWLGSQATVQEWFGPRKARSFGTRFWEVVNRNWEISWQFEVNQIADDLSGLTAQAVSEARASGIKWARHEDLLVAATLELGSSKNCYDGQFFFSASHPVDVEGITSGTFSNLLTSASLGYSSFDSAVTQMHSYKLEDGSPMVPPGVPMKLIHPPKLRQKAFDICKQPWMTPAASYGLVGTSGASANPFLGLAEPVENPYLTSDTTWYLVAEDAGMMPLMFQRRQAIESQELGPGSQLHFDEKKIQIGSDARYEASYTFPQLAIQNTA